jgi:tripartite-type tricarboxylate transporter receptor subunit TctC
MPQKNKGDKMTSKASIVMRYLLPVAAAFSALSVSPVAVAQEFPNKPIRLLVPFGPGGITDIVARQLAKGMGEKLGQQVVVENKPSAGHVVSMQTVAHAQPDGYTIMIGSNTGFSVTPHLFKNISFDIKDFKLIAPVISSPPVLLARPDFPANSLSEFIKLAKSKPGAINYASYGMSSSAHLAMEILQKDTGIKLVHVPYKGDASATVALMGKEVDVAINSMFSAQSRIRSGEMKALAVFQSDRFSSLPSVQTPAEVGSKKAALPIWLAVFAPAGTPRDVMDKLEKATRSVTLQQEFKDFVRNRGSDPLDVDNARFMQIIQEESSNIGVIVNAMGLKPE